MNDDGYATLWTVLLLAVLTILARTAVTLPARTAVEFTAFREETNRKALLEAALVETIETLRDDPNPQSDAPCDPLWSRLREGFGDGIEVTACDISSAMNPNAVSLAILNDGALRTKFRYFSAPAEMKRRIESEGFFTMPGDFEDFLPESSTGLLFTLYGLWNPAVSDRVSLERLILERTGSAEAASLASALIEAGSLPSGTTLARYENILGSAADLMRPLITDEPLINVHFADVDLLRIVLGMDFDGRSLPDPAGALGSILASRLTGEITPSSLRRLIAVEDGQESVFEILGTKTWFWKITVESGEDSLSAVLARIPGAADDERPDFQIVSRRLERRPE